MRREYHRWYSPILGRDMEILEFGHAGTPMIVFPTTRGTFHEYEDRDMITAVRDQYENGHVHAFCVTSVDAESWYNRRVHPAQRVRRHNQYDAYLMNEVVPLIKHRNQSPLLATTGCSFGGYHAINFALKHPDVVTHCVSMGGAYDLHSFMGGYYNEDFYYNQPLDYLPNLNDGWYWNHYQRMKIILAAGEHDICLNDNVRLSDRLRQKSIPHWLDIWGNETGHDWHWWRAMAQKYF